VAERFRLDDLLALAERQLSDASVSGPSPDGRFADTEAPAEARALRTAARELRQEVLAWLAEVHPELLSSP
jgi:hypothetical protein